jgi:Cu-processing system permease protein
MSLFFGLSTSLVVSFLVGSGLPILYFESSPTGLIMILMGCMLSVIFVAIALLTSVITREKTKGIGLAIFLWLYFAIIFDGLVVFFLFQFADFPLEKPMMVISGLNPIDLSRIIILLRLDTLALMGYTGAVFKNFFGNSIGSLSAMITLLLWIAVPLYVSLRVFTKKDL